MRTIHIGIGHDNDLIIAKLRNIKIISISFGESTSKRINHRLDFRVGKYFINRCLLNVQNLTSDRQNCLIVTVTRSFGRATRRISLYDKNLTLGGIFLLAVCQLPIRVKRIFLFRQKISLCSLLCFTNLSRFFRTGKNCLKSLQISVKVEYHLFSDYLTCSTGCILIIQLRLCLSLKSRFRMFDRYNRCHTITDISTGKIRIFILKNTDFSGVSIHYCRKCGLKSGQMCTAFCIINIVAEAQHVLAEFVGKLKCYFYLDTFSLAFQINRIMQNLCTMIQIFDKSNDSIRLMIGDIFYFRASFIFKMNRQLRVKICSLMKSALYLSC